MIKQGHRNESDFEFIPKAFVFEWYFLHLCCFLIRYNRFLIYLGIKLVAEWETSISNKKYFFASFGLWAYQWHSHFILSVDRLEFGAFTHYSFVLCTIIFPSIFWCLYLHLASEFSTNGIKIKKKKIDLSKFSYFFTLYFARSIIFI